MSGKLIRVLDKNTYTFSAAQLGNGASITFPVALNIDASQYPYQSLVLRLHSASWGTGASFAIAGYHSSVSEDDPGLLFRSTSALLTATTTFGDPSPGLKVAGATVGGAAAGLDILVTITQATAAQTITFVVSADLAMKS